MNQRRVVVTGLGLVTPLGLNVSDTWQAVVAGQSGVEILPQFNQDIFSTKIGAVVKGFNPETVFNPKDARRLDTFILYGAAAAKEAIEDSGLMAMSDQLDKKRVGVLVGSGIGGLPLVEKTEQAIFDAGPRKVSPFFITGTIINTVPAYISMQYGFLGPNFSIVSACTTGTHSIGQAMRMIQYGDADVMVTGGAEMATCVISVGGFSACRALSQRNDDPAAASRPWDKDRDGFVMGEGAGVLVLESLEHAQARGAKIYAEITGFGMSADAYHFTAPDPDAKGFCLSMENALQNAKLAPEKVDYINAHATSTPLGDELEAGAIKKTFGEHAYKLAISSTKSMTGHLLGAAGAIEAIFSILAIRDQIAPPTINLHEPSAGCDLDFVPNQAKPMKIDAVLSNSFGFGGTNGSLIFEKFK